MIQNNFIELEMYPEKTTKNTVRFKEYYEDDECIGLVYVKKDVLKELGWVDGEEITVTIEV